MKQGIRPRRAFASLRFLRGASSSQGPESRELALLELAGRVMISGPPPARRRGWGKSRQLWRVRQPTTRWLGFDRCQPVVPITVDAPAAEGRWILCRPKGITHSEQHVRYHQLAEDAFAGLGSDWCCFAPAGPVLAVPVPHCVLVAQSLLHRFGNRCRLPSPKLAPEQCLDCLELDTRDPGASVLQATRYGRGNFEPRLAGRSEE